MGTPVNAASVSEVMSSGAVQRLPVHVYPQTDELFSSWMTRLALANGLRVNQLAGLLTGRQRQLFCGDPDRGVWCVPDLRLAAMAGMNPRAVQRTHLQAYESYLWERVPKRGVWRHVLHHADGCRRVPLLGLQYCPACLASDATPFFRRHWRLAFSVVCDCHGCALEECCPHCGSAVQPPRVGVKALRFDGPMSLVLCTNCHGSLLEAPHRARPSDQLIDFQRLLLATLERGWISMGGRCVHSVAFFEGVHMLMSLLDDGHRSSRLIQVINHDFAMPKVSQQCRYGGIEHRPWARRYAVVELLAEMLTDWPERAMETFGLAGLSSSKVFRYWNGPAATVPYWLWRPVKDHLDRTMYVPSDEEVNHAWRFLQRSIEHPTAKQLCQLLNMATRSNARVYAVCAMEKSERRGASMPLHKRTRRQSPAPFA